MRLFICRFESDTERINSGIVVNDSGDEEIVLECAVPNQLYNFNVGEIFVRRGINLIRQFKKSGYSVQFLNQKQANKVIGNHFVPIHAVCIRDVRSWYLYGPHKTTKLSETQLLFEWWASHGLSALGSRGDEAPPDEVVAGSNPGGGCWFSKICEVPLLRFTVWLRCYQYSYYE